MNGKVLTKWFIVAVVLLIGIYDLIAAFFFGAAATISQVTGLSAAVTAPTIPFVFGFIMGHLFWPQKLKKKSSE